MAVTNDGVHLGSNQLRKIFFYDHDINHGYSLLSNLPHNPAGLAIYQNQLLHLRSDEQVYLHTISHGLNTEFDILFRMRAALDVIFGILQRRRNVFGLRFDILSRLRSVIQLRFDIYQRVRSILPLTFGILGRLGADITMQFDILQRRANQLPVQFSILRRLASTLSLAFDALTRKSTQQITDFGDSRLLGQVNESLAAGIAAINNQVFIAAGNRTTLTRYDITDTSLTNRQELTEPGFTPANALTQKDGFLYLASATSPHLWQINPAGGSVDFGDLDLPGVTALSIYNNHLYVANRESLYRYDIDSNSITNRMLLKSDGFRISGLAVSDEGVFMGSNQTKRVYLFSHDLQKGHIILNNLTHNPAGLDIYQSQLLHLRSDEQVYLHAMTHGMSILFEIAGRLGATLSMTFNILQRRTSQLPISFDMLGRLAAVLSIRFNIFHTLITQFPLSFDILRRLDTSTPISFNILFRRFSSLPINFTLLGRMAAGIRVLFDIHNTRTATFDLSFSIIEAFRIGFRVINDTRSKFRTRLRQRKTFKF